MSRSTLRQLASAAFAISTLTCGVAFFTSPANAGVLSFDGANCGFSDGRPCGNGDMISQSYGDQTGLDVQYRGIPTGDGVVIDGLRYWGSGYSGLTGVVYTDDSSLQHYGEITFLPDAGYEVTISGFLAGCYNGTASCLLLPYSVDEIGGLSSFLSVPGGASLASASGFATPGATAANVTFTLPYSQNGYVLRWGPDAYNGGLDNIVFDVRALGGAVPEPATWAMMMIGFGAMGGAMRSRRRRRFSALATNA